jgi:UDP-glucose 4-epimerase
VGCCRIARPVLVLGGSGFLGGHLVAALLEQGCDVRVFNRAHEGGRPPAPAGVDFRAGEFSNREDVAAALEGCSTVFHVLGTTLPQTSNDDPVYDLESNLLTTVQFLDLARRGGVEKIVFASSGGTVYGVPSMVPIGEDHAPSPLCSYAIHKLAIELYLRLYHDLYGLDYCVLRIANAFGERQSPLASQGAVSVFLYRAMRGEEIVIWGDGSVVRDYVYVGDVAQAFCAAARHLGSPRTFNIGSGSGRSLNEVISSIETLLGRSVARSYHPGRALDVPVNVLDSSLAAKHLGWRPQHEFVDGLRRTFEWLKAEYPS